MLENVVEQFGEGLLGIISGGAFVAMFMEIVSYVTGF